MNDMSALQTELESAIRLAREAGAIIMEIYRTNFSVGYKGVEDPVTEADTRANELIVTGIHQAFPEDSIVAEESPLPQESFMDRIWYVDPLDGTREFIAKNGEFSVMIGLAVNRQASLGVVYRPDQDVLFAGIVGQEAWRESGGRRTSLKTSMNTDPRDLGLVVSRSHRHRAIDALRETIGVSREISCGSVGLKIGLIATTEADMYIEPAPYTSHWDACAPEAIIRGAGGQLTNVSGEPIVYGRKNVKNTRGLVATNGACHALVIHAIEPLVKGWYQDEPSTLTSP